jgi:putative ABC transport system permease protein
MSVPLARRNLMHEKGKLLLSVLGIGAALALVMILLGFRAGLYATLTDYIDNLGADLVIAQRGVKGLFSSDSLLGLDLHDELSTRAGAEEAAHILVADVIITRGEIKTPVILVGYDPESSLGDPWDIGEGRQVQAEDEILLDSWLAQRMDVGIGDQISMLGDDYWLVGLTRGTSSWMSPYVFINLKAAETALGAQGLVSFHLLRLPEGANVEQARRLAERASDGIEALTPDDLADADRRVVATIMETPLMVMVAISTVIGAAVMGLTAYTAVSDHLREYGVLKAVGADRRQLVRLVLTETLYRTLLGYVAGVGMAFISARIVMALWPQFVIFIQPEVVMASIPLAFLMTVPAAWLPVRRLMDIDPLLVFKA